jgi:hypothetical protein
LSMRWRVKRRGSLYTWRSSMTRRRPSSMRALTVVPSRAATRLASVSRGSKISTVVFIHKTMTFDPYVWEGPLHLARPHHRWPT